MYFEVQEEIELESVEEVPPVTTKTEIHIFDDCDGDDKPDPNDLQCSDCHRIFNSKQELIAHRLISHQSEKKKYQCQKCKRVFASPSSLHCHKKLHSGAKQFSCDICKKEFTQLTNLQRHIFTHSGERPFACTICDKRFTQKSNVDKHQLTHAKTKPFKCSTCDKGFTQKVNLIKHEMIHSGLRPFVCEICSKAYTQLVNLNKHMQTHTKPRDSVSHDKTAYDHMRGNLGKPRYSPRYDISDLIEHDKFIEGQNRPEDHQTTRLYIVKNVPTETVFVPRTRMEIKSCEWFSLEHLPTHKTDTICKIHLGINANSFFMIMPYVKQLKRFLQQGNSSQAMDFMGDNQMQKNKKYPNGASSNGSGLMGVTKKRQRHKSLGDLDGVRPLSGVSIGFQQQGKVPTNALPNFGSSVIASNGKRKVKPNSRRQLFGGEGVLSGNSEFSATGHYFDDNANATPTNFGKMSHVKTISSRQSNQLRPNNSVQRKVLVPIDDFLKSDPYIDRWNHFTFDRSKLFCKF